MTTADECRPRLFVYRLPDAYRNLATSADPTSDSMPADGLGRPLNLQQIGSPTWSSEQYSLASLVHERALAYRCRTHDPAQADLFIVPAYRETLGSDIKCAERQGSRLKLIHRLQLPLPNRTYRRHASSNSAADGGNDDGAVRTLTARGGADHVILNPRNGQPWDRFPYCEFALGAPELGAAVHLAMEAHPHNASWVYPEGYCGKVCVPAYRPQLLSEAFY